MPTLPDRATRWMLALCRLAETPRYQHLKGWLRVLLHDDHSRHKQTFDSAMIVLIMVTIGCFLYEVHHRLPVWALWLERVAVGIFALEYLLRLWVHDDSHRLILRDYQNAAASDQRFRLLPSIARVARSKWDYVASPLAIIDLLAILPSYRPLRMLRIFLLFRVIKLFRYTQSLKQLTQVLSEKRFEIYTLGLFVGFMVFASATGIYLMEANDSRSEINSFFDAVYWAVITLSTVGYGDITPQTTEGRFITLILIVSGIAVLSFSTSIIVSAFSERLVVMRERRVHLEVEKLHDMVLICGYGRVGEVVASRLQADRQPLLILDHHQSRVDLAQRRGLLALHADASRNEVLEEADIHRRAHTVVCITDSDVSNVFIALTVRQLNPAIRIIARASHTDSIDKLYRAGADSVVTANEMVGLLAAQLVNHPLSANLLIHALGGQGPGMEAVRVGENSPLAHRPVAALADLAPQLLLFGVVTDDRREAAGICLPLRGRRFHFHPPSTFALRPGDQLMLMGEGGQLLAFRKRVQGYRLTR